MSSLKILRTRCYLKTMRIKTLFLTSDKLYARFKGNKIFREWELSRVKTGGPLFMMQFFVKSDSLFLLIDSYRSSASKPSYHAGDASVFSSPVD